MSMYECENCGYDFATFPSVFLAVNTDDPIFPYHNTEFEKKFDEIARYYKTQGFSPSLWNDFWAWLGDKKIKWFCSKKCAIEYLQKGDNDAAVPEPSQET